MTTCFGCVECCMWYLYPIIVLICLLHGQQTTNMVLEDVLGDAIYIIIKPDILGTIAWIIIIFFPLIYQLKGDNFNLFGISYIMLFIGFIIINLPRDHNDHQHSVLMYTIQTEYIQSLLSLLLFSICIYKQFSLNQQVQIQNNWFNQRYKISSTPNKYLKWIMYFAVNIFVYYHCFIYLDQCNLMTFNMTVRTIWSVSIVISFYLSPFNIPFDLYFNRYQMNTIIINHIFTETYLLIYVYFLKEYIAIILHRVIMHISLFIWVFSFVALPTIFNTLNHKKFLRILKTTQESNIFTESWLRYILLNNISFQNLGMFLISSKVYENMLFVIEISQYKHAVQRRLNYLLNNNECLLSLDENIDGMIVSPIVQEINSIDLEQLTLQRIKIDMILLYEKYMLHYDDDKHCLYLSFISKQMKDEIENKLQTIDDYQVLNVFDQAIKTCSDILQLMYTQYVIRG